MVLIIVLVLLLLAFGNQIALLLAECGKVLQNRMGKVAIWILAVSLPILLWAAVLVCCGIAKCSCCRSVTINTYNKNYWVSTVKVCRKCVKYVDVCKFCVKYADSKNAEQLKEPEKNAADRYVCYTCDGNINMHDDEEGELFFQIGLIFWTIGYWMTMIVMGVAGLVKKYKRKVEGD